MVVAMCISQQQSSDFSQHSDQHAYTSQYLVLGVSMHPCSWLVDRLCGDRRQVVVCYLCQEEVSTQGWLSGDHR